MIQELSGFMPKDGPQLFDRTIGELLAAFYRRRWPQNTAKRVAAKVDIDLTTAINLTKGKASERTIAKAIRCEGWPLLMALGEAMTGQAYDEFLESIVNEQERIRERAQARRDHLRHLEARAAQLVGVEPRTLDRGGE